MIDNAMIQTIYDVQKHNTILNWRAWYPRHKIEASTSIKLILKNANQFLQLRRIEWNTKLLHEPI